MDTGINLSQEQLQKLSINQIQSLHILSLSAESYTIYYKKSPKKILLWITALSQPTAFPLMVLLHF